VRQATAKTGTPKDPKVTLLEIETVSEDKASTGQRQHVATLLGLGADAVPPLRLKGCHLSQGQGGELVGRCPKMPSDLEAKIGAHVDTKDPSKKEEVFGYVHLTTTDLNQELALELPIGNSTDPANAHEGTGFIAHRSKRAIPVLPVQGQLGDAANERLSGN